MGTVRVSPDAIWYPLQSAKPASCGVLGVPSSPGPGGERDARARSDDDDWILGAGVLKRGRESFWRLADVQLAPGAVMDTVKPRSC